MDERTGILPAAQVFFWQSVVRKVSTDEMAKHSAVLKAIVNRKINSKGEISEEIVKTQAYQLCREWL